MWNHVLEEISQAKGKQKEEILRKEKNTPYLKEVLQFVFDPLTKTGISMKKWNKAYENMEISEYSKDLLDTPIKIINYLKDNNTGKIEDVELLLHSINMKFNENEQVWLEALVIKDIPIGISSKTINKVWPNLIVEFNLMKCTKYEHQDLENKNIVVTPKLDGNNGSVFNLLEETYILSSSGRKIEGLQHIIDFYRKKLPIGYIYVGELLAVDKEFEDHGKRFQYGNGIINSKAKEKKEIAHFIFDVIPYNDFLSKKSNVLTYANRRKSLQNMFVFINQDTNDYYPLSKSLDFNQKNWPVSLVPIIERNSENNNEYIIESMNKALSHKLEGVIINDLDAKYEFKRSKGIYKFKNFHTMDLEVVSIEEHIRGGKVGSLKVDYKGNIVGIPQLTDDLRELWWDQPDLIVGKIIEITYFRETEDENGKPSLRFPSFIRVREDKNYDDVSYD